MTGSRAPAYRRRARSERTHGFVGSGVFIAPVRYLRLVPSEQEASMGLLDRLLGRGKKAAGDLAGDSSLRREGMHQEREGMAEDRAAQHEQMAQENRERAAEERAERES